MGFDLMCFQIHFRIEHDELLFQTLAIGAKKVVFSKVVLKRVIIDIVLLLAAAVTSVANVAALVLVSTVRIQLIVAIESLSAKPAFRVSLEAALIDGARVIVAELLVLP